MSISTPFILRPIATSLLMVAIFMVGIFTYGLLPISSLPEIDYPTIIVTTNYPGASPKVIASSITSPLEKQFGQMPGMNQMNSTSSMGLSSITLRFDLNLNIDIAEQEVQAAINSASNLLPSNLPNPPIYSKVNPADPPIITLALTSTTIPLQKIEDYAETRFAQKISELSGVGLVSILGGQRPAIRIQTNTVALASYGLDIESIRTAVTAANINGAKGTFDGNQLSYIINSNDQLISSEEYSSLIISYQNNAPVRLRDVAKVVDSVENIDQAAWVNNEPAIIVNIQRQPGANVIKVVDTIKNLLPNLSSTLPKSIKVLILSDRTQVIRASDEGIKIELALSILLVVLVIFIFLHNASATIIPSIAVPLSLIGTFGVIYLLGFSINNLTLMALTIATGFVVDDAVVMIENINRYIEKGLTPLEASIKGAKQIGFTIISLTISLIAVLIPLLFMQDIIGMLFREFALTLAISILISAFISLTLTPMLCSQIMKPEKSEKSKLENIFIKSFDSILNKYSTSLKYALQNQTLVLISVIITLIITFLLFYYIPKGFFPAQDIGLIQGISQAKQSSSFSAMRDNQHEIAKVILNDPGVETVVSILGINNSNSTLNSIFLQINLKPQSQRDNVLIIIKRLQDKLNQLSSSNSYLQPIQDLSINDKISMAQYQYTLSSHDPLELKIYEQKFIKSLNESSLIKNVSSDQHYDGLQTYIKINRDVAAKLGITNQIITDTLYNMFGQRQISTIFTQRNQYKVIIELLPELRTGIQSLDQVYIPTSSGGLIPLRQISTNTQKPTELLITRQNQFPVVTISFDLADDASLDKAIKEIQNLENSIKLPKSVQGSFQGTAEVFIGTMSNEWLLIIVAIVIIYLVLGILYESYIHPITIISTLPPACIGALLSLIIFNCELDIIAVIGIILLIGIVKKNAIMMIDFAIEQERVYGKNPHDAIYEACLLRLRPILMTTFASMLGSVPLLMQSSMGSEIRQPLGITVIGGLALSQLLTLYTTPVVYLTFDKLAKRVNNWKISKKFSNSEQS